MTQKSLGRREDATHPRGARPPSSTRPRAPLAPKLALLAGSLLLSLLAGEVGLRLRFGPPVHFRYPQERYRADSEIGHWLEPNQRSFSHDKPVQANSIGLRERDYPRVPSGARRILAIGDSQTYGEGLELDETWPKQLEAGLNAAEGGRRWEVVNGGISGTDSWQHERVLRRLAGIYDFDLVLLALYVNDVAPIYTPQPASALTNTVGKRIGYLLKRSALFSLLWRTWQSRFASAYVGIREHSILRGEASPHAEAGWQQVERSIAAMRAICNEKGAGLLLIVIPRRDQVDGTESGTGYNRQAAEIAARLEIPVVDVLIPLRAAYMQHGSSLFIPWDGHNSAAANQVIAVEILRALRERRVSS